MNNQIEIYNVNFVQNMKGDIQQSINNCHECTASQKIETIDLKVEAILAILDEQKKITRRLFNNHFK